MLGELREEAPGGGEVMMALQDLLFDPPEPRAYHNVSTPRFEELALELLRDSYTSRHGKSAWSGAVADLLEVLEDRLEDTLEALNPAFDWPAAADALGPEAAEAARRLGAPEAPPFDGLGPGQRHVFFVLLPLGLYVRNTMHLYNLLGRLRGLRGTEGPVAMRAALDGAAADGRPYSALVYAVLAALQALHGAAHDPSWGAAAGLGRLWPLNGSGGQAEAQLGLRGARLMFRGIWVPAEIDEDAARCQWSFNSFSRHLEGVRSVLKFYARSLGSDASRIAAEHGHVLLLVARRKCGSEADADSSDWIFPVQFFNAHTTAEGPIEQELLVPPFARYEFEEEHEVSSAMPAHQWESRLESLERLWQLPPGGLDTEAPELRGWLRKGPGMAAVLPAAPRVTVRFVRRVGLAEPVHRLLVQGSPALWSFPRPPRAGARASAASGPSPSRPLCTAAPWLHARPGTPARAPARGRLWRVSAGDLRGGLLVREGRELSSAP